jgi:hypothetical protein
MTYRHPLIKDKALSFPQTFSRRHFLKVLQYPSFQMIHLQHVTLKSAYLSSIPARLMIDPSVSRVLEPK